MTTLNVLDMRLRRGVGAESFNLRIHSLSLSTGQMVALHGASGLGKSTCLELLAGVVRPDEAEVFTLVMDDGGCIDLAKPGIDTAPLRAGSIGFGPQSGGLISFLNGRSNARAALDLTGRGRDPILQERFDWIVGRLGLSDCLSKNRGALSGGQRKRISLLRAMAVPRKLLILDEPTAGLDDNLADHAIACITQICAEESTICVTAMHDVDRAAAFGMLPLQLCPEPGGASLGARVGVAA